MDFSNVFDAVETQSKIQSLEVKERLDSSIAISSGSLAVDVVILAGGYYPGRAYDWVGPESGGKTTLGNSALANALHFIPKHSVGHYYDFEGSLDTTWFMNIAGLQDSSPDEVFGRKNKNNAWDIVPRIRLYKPTFGEQGLILMTKHLNSLPDKSLIMDAWRYTWTPVEAKVKKKTGGLLAKDIEAMLKARGIQWDKSILRETGLYTVEVPDNYGGCEGVIFVDSWAAMTPRQTAEDDSAAMAQQGRMFGTYINQVKTLISNKGWICIGVNQVRQNPNTRFGSCFSYHTKVLLEDMTTCNIGQLVNEKRFDKKVMTYNENTGNFEPKRIVRGWKRPVKTTDNIVKLTYDAPTSNGASSTSYVIVTDNHVFFTKDGEKYVRDLKVGDILLGYNETMSLCPDQKQVLYGSILGDGELFFTSTYFYIMYNHVHYQKKYLQWKISLLGSSSELRKTTYRTSKGKLNELYSQNSARFTLTRIPKQLRYLKKRSQCSIPQDFIQKLDIRAVAIWFMDDGDVWHNSRDGWGLKIACERLSEDSRIRLSVRLSDIFNVDVSYTDKSVKVSTKDNVLAFLKKIAPYIHTSMSFKLKGLIREKDIGTYDWSICRDTASPKKIRVLNIEKSVMSGSKYDLEIEDNHNYIVGGKNGIIVHNSEYNPGGEALKHFCDCRNRIGTVSNQNGSGATELENDGLDEYKHFIIRNKKNKVSTPYGEVRGRWWTKRDGHTGCGIDPVFDTITYLEITNQVEKSRRGYSISLKDDSKAASNLNGLKFTYDDFKFMILNKQVDTGKRTVKFDLRKHCFKQIRSGIGMELYYKNLAAIEAEQEDEDE